MQLQFRLQAPRFPFWTSSCFFVCSIFSPPFHVSIIPRTYVIVNTFFEKNGLFMRKFNIISRIQMIDSGFFYAVLDGDTKDIQQKSNAKEGAVVRNGGCLFLHRKRVIPMQKAQ